MAKPLEELKDEYYIMETYLLYGCLSEVCRDTEDCKKILGELLTSSELRMLKRRWYIARLLTSGKSMREVAHDVKVSTATVVRVAQVLNSGNSILKKALEKVKFESSISQPPKSGKKYIFGHE